MKTKIIAVLRSMLRTNHLVDIVEIPIDSDNNNNNNNWFLYSAFLVWDTAQSALQCIITPVTGFNINPALKVHLLNSLGSILARYYFRGAHMPYHATNNVRILYRVPIYTPGWRAAMRIKCLDEGYKVPGIDGNRTRNPLIQSQGFNPIYHGTCYMLYVIDSILTFM